MSRKNRRSKSRRRTITKLSSRGTCGLRLSNREKCRNNSCWTEVSQICSTQWTQMWQPLQTNPCRLSGRWSRANCSWTIQGTHFSGLPPTKKSWERMPAQSRFSGSKWSPRRENSCLKWRAKSPTKTFPMTRCAASCDNWDSSLSCREITSNSISVWRRNAPSSSPPRCTDTSLSEPIMPGSKNYLKFCTHYCLLSLPMQMSKC